MCGTCCRELTSTRTDANTVTPGSAGPQSERDSPQVVSTRRACHGPGRWAARHLHSAHQLQPNSIQCFQLHPLPQLAPQQPPPRLIMPSPLPYTRASYPAPAAPPHLLPLPRLSPPAGNACSAHPTRHRDRRPILILSRAPASIRSGHRSRRGGAARAALLTSRPAQPEVGGKCGPKAWSRCGGLERSRGSERPPSGAPYDVSPAASAPPAVPLGRPHGVRPVACDGISIRLVTTLLSEIPLSYLRR